MLLEANKYVNNFVWGPLMLILLIGMGIYLSIRTKFFSIAANNLTVGIVLAMLVAFVILGGIKRSGLVTEKLVPIMDT